MPLQKGFLRKPKYRFHKQFVITSILLAIGHTIAWYYFLVIFKEAIRVSSYSMTDYLLVLTKEENFFFNWFYANIALIIGLSAGAKFLFESSIKVENPFHRGTRLFIINNQSFQTWNYILWFTKVFSLFGGWVLCAPEMFFEIDFSKNHKHFFILFAFVWYLNLWLGFYRLRFTKSIKYMALLFFLLQIVSVLLAFNNVLKIDEINKNLLSTSIMHKYQIDLPEFDILHPKRRVRRKLIVDHYLGINKNQIAHENNVVIEDASSNSLLEKDKLKIQKHIYNESQNISEIERDQMIHFLYVDGKVRMKTVNQVKELLSSINQRRICQVVVPKSRRYPVDYPGYRTYGFYEMLPLNCQEVKDQIDSLSKLGYKLANLKFRHKYYCYRGLDFNHWNRFVVRLNSKNEIHINNSTVTENDLFNWTFSFFKKYGSKGIVLFDVDENVTFEQYIKTKSSIYNAIILNRIIEARKLFKVDYTKLDWFNPVDYEMKIEIDPKFPVNIVELNETDKFLYEFSKN